MSGIYQLAHPAQLSPTEFALSLNIRACGVTAIDLEIGNDLLIADDLQSGQYRVMPLDRYTFGPNPLTGKEVLFAHYPKNLAFVPLGAKHADGTPHPYAGTGFIIGQILSFPIEALDKSNCFDGIPEEEIFYGLEIGQCTYDGKDFKIRDLQIRKISDFLPGMVIGGGSLGSIVPDGDDMLIAFNCDKDVGKKEVRGCGVLRWKNKNGNWEVQEYLPIIEPDYEHFHTMNGVTANYVEPSLARAWDGSLIFTAREIGPEPFGYETKEGSRLTVWHSTDQGKSWKVIIEKENFHTQTPLSVGVTASGIPYIVANEFCTHNSKGERLTSIILREKLLVWPIKQDFSGLEEPICACDAPVEFGEPPNQSFWRVDHPIGLPVRLKDGKWHSILCFRTLEHLECDSNALPTPFTGSYVREIFSTGNDFPLWIFD
ncbi:MAG: hypothetical protein GX946_02075 [Oligosphaeraceae bacterium]|nr:hypothetical protein [Oligosphaeraceae bacterium]